MTHRVRVLAPVGILAGYAVIHRLGRTYGSTALERAAALPGDDLVRNPQVVADHAITIDATPTAVWPWLVQVGWHRGGWYTARWVDALLFPANRASAEVVIPELQGLAVGDVIPDGPPESGCEFVVADLEPDVRLVLHSTSHLPLTWRTRLGASVDWSWVFVLSPLEDGTRTRFHFRWRARTAPWWVRALSWTFVVPADLVMSHDMLRGIKRRAETGPQSVVTVSSPPA